MALFAFPNPVNEVAARVVAGCVAVIALLALVLQLPVLIAVLAYGFVARTLTGPTLSPLAQFATRVAAPRIGDRPVAGPPKRFAQGMGAVVTVSAAVLYFGLGLHTAAYVLVGLIVAAATLESVLAFCIGCRVFGLLMRLNLVPDTVCADCANIWRRLESPGEAS